LGCGAYLSELRRTRIGAYAVENAQVIEKFMDGLRDDKNEWQA
jgi:tRNA U55 pseudouridine synthase TruB